MQERKHPLLFLIVLDHGLHGLVLVDKRTDPAPKPAVSAGRRGRVHDQGTLAVGGSALVHGEKLLVVMAPWIRMLHEEHPDVVVRPVFDRAVHQGVREARVWTKPVANPVLLQAGHHLGAG